MPWDAAQDAALLAYYRALVALRRRMGRLWRAARTTLLADDATGRYAYACTDDPRRAVVVLNLGPTPQRVTLEAVAGLEIALATDATVKRSDTTVELGPYAGAILA
jgi:hypothetical protein